MSSSATRPFAHHFDSAEQQRETAALCMWVFLATEVMFFGGLFVAYIAYRASFPAAFAAASRRLDVTLGAANTAVLIGSSLTMALAVRGAQQGRRLPIIIFLILTMILGSAFLGVKAYEYHHKAVEHLLPGHGFEFQADQSRPAQIFFCLYFGMTGLHALHMIIGLGVLFVMIILAARGRFTPEYHNSIENAGLYWHFVDIIWIFLFPLLYLVERHG
jgi:cytochrome c oxidase subunit 3